MQPEDTVSGRPFSQPVSRRVLGAAAWTAPVVLAARGVPAFAASPRGKLSLNYFNVYGANYVNGAYTALESGLSVLNVYTPTSPTLTSITVSVRIPATRVAGAPATLKAGPPGWAASGAVLSGADWVYTFTYTGSVSPGGGTTDLKFVVPLRNTVAAPFVMTATASGSAVESATSTISATL